MKRNILNLTNNPQAYAIAALEHVLARNGINEAATITIEVEMPNFSNGTHICVLRPAAIKLAYGMTASRFMAQLHAKGKIRPSQDNDITSNSFTYVGQEGGFDLHDAFAFELLVRRARPGHMFYCDGEIVWN